MITMNTSSHAVWPDWEELKSVRLEQDDLLSKGTREWTEDWLAGKTIKRDPQGDNLPAIPRWVMVVQLFNHQTHHHSQITGALDFKGLIMVQQIFRGVREQVILRDRAIELTNEDSQ